MKFNEITLLDINELANMYIETFNSPTWNDEWTIENASKRLHQMIHCEDFYGIKAYQEEGLKSYNSMVMMGKEL